MTRAGTAADAAASSGAEDTSAVDFSAVDFATLFEGLPTAYLVMTPDLVIAEVNSTYCQLLGRSRDDLLGRYVFDAFPPTPDALDEHGRNPLQVSFERARDTRRADPLTLFTYAVTDPVTGEAVERHWSLIAAPLLDADGATSLVIQRVEDVSDYVRASRAAGLTTTPGGTPVGTAPGTSADPPVGPPVGAAGDHDLASWQTRAARVEAELFARVQDLQAARTAERATAARLAALAEVTTAVTTAQSVEELANLLTEQGLAATGSDSGAIAVLAQEPGWLDLTITAGFGAATQRDYARLPADGPLPACVAATTGRSVYLHDAEQALAWAPQMADVMASTGEVAFASLPLDVGGRRLGSLTAGWRHPQAFGADRVSLLEAFAAQCAQALERIQVRATERTAAQRTTEAWQTLQRSLLTSPPEPDHAQVVVRYRPAAHAAQVGGDWYDAFFQHDGATVLVIGDVIGHDTSAAAAMGQVRGTLRALGAYADLGPAELLSATDRTMHELMLPTVATALVARLEQSGEQRAQGLTDIRWSSAGHLPAMLIAADGTVTPLVGSDSDLLLGIFHGVQRHESTVTVERGATLVMYTDGLVERRGESLEVGLGRLQELLARLCSSPPDITAAYDGDDGVDGEPGEPGRPGPDLDALVDAVLDDLVDGDHEDDVAVIAVRLHPEDRPRPAAAGPEVISDVVS